MPKKRRDRRPNVPMQTGPIPLETTETRAPSRSASVRNVSEPAQARTASAQSGLKTDFTIVLADLKRIAVIGGGLIAVLVVLSFFIR